VFSGKTIFSQIVELIHPQQFHRCVARYRGDYKVKAFSCWAIASVIPKLFGFDHQPRLTRTNSALRIANRSSLKQQRALP
jgi:hypothetical protein